MLPYPEWTDLRKSLSSPLRRSPRTIYPLVGIALLMAAVLGAYFFSSRQQPVVRRTDAASRDIRRLRRDVTLMEARIRKLTERRSRLFPAGRAILVDTADNRIRLLRGSKLLAEDKCSTGSGLVLTDATGLRTWTFETPRGYFPAKAKVTNPVWIRPDWAFIEEGAAIPKDRASRAVPDVLGDYAIGFGDGYFIHGTLYTRMLGNNVTHGCIRVDDDTLKTLYQNTENGTPIWIF